MPRPRTKSPLRLSKDAERLIAMASAACASGSCTEERFWDREIETLIARMLDAAGDAGIEGALDQIFQINVPAYDVLIDSCETVAESCLFDTGEGTWRALLIAVPLVAWSKYAIAAGKLKPADVAPIVTHLHAHILADNVKLTVNPFLYAIEHLPRGFAETRRLMRKMGQAALNGTDAKIDYAGLGAAAEMPADTRMLLAVAVAPEGVPIFRWQQADAHASRTECLTTWIEQCRPNLVRLVPGANIECGLPDAYFRNCRDCDRRVRPYVVSSAVSYLESALRTSAAQLTAFIAGVGEERVDEFRIGFARRGQAEMVHGVVWPLYGQEDDDANPGPRKEIDTILRDCKVGEIVHVPAIQPPEFCEDCGAPLFFDADAEALHAEMPEDFDQPTSQYH